ncbi:MAG TPA: aldehyde dehydrogenase family protein, partial [Thermoanaerobaculia bacterium]
MSMKAVNPATGEVLREYPEHDDREVRQKLEQAEEAFASWRKVPIAERARLMSRAADLLRDRSDEYGRLMTEEMGKPIAAAESEVDKCAWVCEFYAEHAERFLASETVATDATRSGIRYDPLGAVLAIMPWNFPFWQHF